MDPKQYQRNLASLRQRAMGQFSVNDAAAATGQIFMTTELTKLDPTLRMPYFGITHWRHLPIVTGGGWIMNETAQNVDFAGAGDEIPGSDSNDTPVVNFNFSQDVWPVFPYKVKVRIPIIEGLRLAQANKSPSEILDKAVRAHYGKALDTQAYVGRKNSYGLLNNPVVASYVLPATGTGASSSWASKLANPALILADFNYMATTTLQQSNNAPEGMPDTFLLPYAAIAQLTTPMTLGSGGGVFSSIAEYIKANYFGKAMGVTPTIDALPSWLDTAGPGGVPMMVAYRKNVDCLSLSIPQELTPVDGPVSMTSEAYERLYLANIGVVKVNRPQTMAYFYGQ